MAIVNNVQLQEILEDLLLKIKNKTENAYNNISFDDSSSNLELTSVNGNATTVNIPLRDKFNSIDMTEEKISFKNDDTELTSIPITTTAEIELILQNLR